MKLRQRLATGLLLALACLLPISALADSAEAIADDAIVQMDRMATALLTVKDKESAEKAVTELMAIAGDLKKIAARAKTAATPTPEEKAKVLAKMQAKSLEIKNRLGQAKEQLAKAGLEAAAVLGKGMMEFGRAMQEVGQAFEAADK